MMFSEWTRISDSIFSYQEQALNDFRNIKLPFLPVDFEFISSINLANSATTTISINNQGKNSFIQFFTSRNRRFLTSPSQRK